MFFKEFWEIKLHDEPFATSKENWVLSIKETRKEKNVIITVSL